MYNEVATVLSSWTSGKIPKAFKIIPTFKEWQEILTLCTPERWSPNAVYEAVRIFVSQFQPADARIFMNTIVLPRVRADIKQEKKVRSSVMRHDD